MKQLHSAFASDVEKYVDISEGMPMRPVQLRKGDNATIYPWGEVRRYMTDCVPIYAQ